MYFLPEFLAHYRGLGVERFVFLNDRSDDGSFEYLLQQPDTVVVESSRRYGDTVDFPPALSDEPGSRRILFLWRTLLHEIFARDRWALQVDLDEFVHLPEGMTFQDMVLHLERQDRHQVWGVMLDVYPENIAALAEQKDTSRLGMSTTWYFDGEMHLRLRRGKKPLTVYPGARSRLYYAFGMDSIFPELAARKSNLSERIRRARFGSFLPRYNQIKRPVLLKWRDECYYVGSHNTNLIGSNRYLLPIQHFKFSGSLYRKIEMGICESRYFKNSLDHRILAELLKKMKEGNGSFLYPNSRSVNSFADFSETRNAVGF